MLKLKFSPSLAVVKVSRDSEMKIFAESGESVGVPAHVGMFMHTCVYVHAHMPVCLCVSFIPRFGSMLQCYKGNDNKM